jgi:uncharacterized protein YndB with AHSA1/START domain
MSKDVIAAEAEMLIHRPVAEVFEALIDPDAQPGSGSREAAGS